MNRLKILFVIVALMFVGMTVYEFTKQYFLPTISLWESHAITIAFSCVIALLIGHFTLVRFEGLLAQREAAEKNLRLGYDELEQKVEDRTRELVRNLKELDFQKLALNEHAIVSITDVKGDITYINDRFSQISGYSLEELMGKNHRVVKSNEHSPEFYADLWRTIANGKVWRGAIKNKRKDGSFYWVDATIVPFLNDQGKPFQYVAIRTDITPLKETEKTLVESEDRFRQIAQVSSDWVWEMDENLRFSYFSESFTPFTQVEPSELLGKTREEFTSPAELAKPEWQVHLKVLDNHQEFRNFQYEFVNPSSSNWFFSISGTPNFDGQGKFLGYRGTGSNITEKIKAERALEIAKNEAEKASHAKSEFLSIMSHELRTPMNAILGFGQMLEANPDEPLTEDQQDSVDHILKGGRHLLDLINQILDLSAVESGKMMLSLEPVQVNDLCLECLSLIDEQSSLRGLSIHSDLGGAKYIEADYVRFKQVLLNLLSNAIKYNNEGGSITLSCADAPENMVRVSIADTGNGVAEDIQSGLFEPFNRLGREASEIEGTGIGLTISKELVETMEGRIGFVSEEGEGSTFWVEMPLSEATTDALVTPEDEDTEYPAGDQGADKATILYIEDNPANLHLMKMIIGKIGGLNMISANSAELGLTMAQEWKPDLILMDINLPGMDGTEAMQKLAATDCTRHIPVIAVSAAAMKKDIEKGLSAGFTAYLTKPFDVPELIKAVKKELDI